MGGEGSGRRRRPTALRSIPGGKSTTAANVVTEPKPETKVIRRPASLTDAAKVYWNRYAPDLIAQGVLTVWDVPMFAILCEAFATYDAARDDIRTRGLIIDGAKPGQKVKNPATTIQKEAVAEIKSLGGKFGMSPSDRAHLEVKPPPGKAGLAEFL